MWKKIIRTSLPFVLLFSGAAEHIMAEVSYEKVVKAEELPIGVLLQWTTLVELNNKEFVIERSENGSDFQALGTLESKGSKNHRQSYRFLDLTAKNPENYYRLKEVDKDDSFNYSKVVKIIKERENNFDILQLSAVATEDVFSVTLDAFLSGMLTYELRDWKTNVNLTEEKIVVEGINHFDIDLTDFHAGIYKLVLKLGEEEEVITLKRIPGEMERKPNMASTRKQDRN